VIMLISAYGSLILSGQRRTGIIMFGFRLVSYLLYVLSLIWFPLSVTHFRSEAEACAAFAYPICRSLTAEVARLGL